MPMPPLKWDLAPCPACGARTEKQAETMCKPSTDQTGEVSCIGEFDKDGMSIQPTAESVKAMDEWINLNCME